MLTGAVSMSRASRAHKSALSIHCVKTASAGRSQIASAIRSTGAAGASSARLPARNHPRPQPVKIVIFTAAKLQADPPRADFVSRLDFPANVKSVPPEEFWDTSVLVVQTPEILSAHFCATPRIYAAAVISSSR